MTIFGTEVWSLNNLFIIVALGTIIGWAFRGYRRAKKSLRTRQVKSGIYFSSWIDPVKAEVNVSTVRLKRSLGKIVVSVLYVHSDRHGFRMTLVPWEKNKSVFSGWWTAKGGSSLYRGPALFTLHSDVFSGRWLGPKRNLSINSGMFILKHLDKRDNSYLQYKRRRLPELRFFRAKPTGDRLEKIIERHDSQKSNRVCNFQNVEIILPNHAFNPSFGKLSYKLLLHALDLETPISDVLDLGSGAGLNAIVLAKKYNAKAVGLEIDAELINAAQSNARKNKVETARFFSVDSNNLYSRLKADDKFDLIIADLPFTSRWNAKKSSRSKQFSNFCGSRKLVESLILGSVYHIRPGGRLVFSYGTSGHKRFLDDLIEISPWEVVAQQPIESKHETFYIYEMALDSEILNLLASDEGKIV